MEGECLGERLDYAVYCFEEFCPGSIDELVDEAKKRLEN